jgi:hypothetical protein
LIFVFGRLLYEEWLNRDDLAGLRKDKIDQIVGIAEFGKNGWTMAHLRSLERKP